MKTKSQPMTDNGQKVHRDLEHQITAKEQPLFQCKPCVIKCSDAEVLKKHTNQEHNFKCQRCNSYFGTESYLQNHMKTVHDWFPYLFVPKTRMRQVVLDAFIQSWYYT